MNFSLFTANIYCMLRYRKTLNGFVAQVRQAVEGDRNGRTVPRNLEEFRERFAAAPLGRWTDSIDYGPWPTTTCEFLSNGTGREYGESGSGHSTWHFEWRTHSEFAIERRFVGYEGDEEEEDDEEEMTAREFPTHWHVVRYGFIEIEHYVPTVVMYFGDEPGPHAYVLNNYHYIGPAD